MQSEYVRLKEDLVRLGSTILDQDALKLVKDQYKRDIGSTRRLTRVKELRSLIDLLERQDILNEGNIQPLCYISNRFINRLDLQSRLVDYKARARSMDCPLRNMYKSGRAEQDANGPTGEVKSTVIDIVEPRISQGANTVKGSEERQDRTTEPLLGCSSNEQILRETVLEQVSDRIGRSWRDAARFLGIRECDIDAIENKYPYDLKGQSYAAFKSYVSQCPDSSWKLSLVQVLEKVRRRDLRETVEKLLIR